MSDSVELKALHETLIWHIADLDTKIQEAQSNVGKSVDNKYKAEYWKAIGVGLLIARSSLEVRLEDNDCNIKDLYRIANINTVDDPEIYHAAIPIGMSNDDAKQFIDDGCEPKSQIDTITEASRTDYRNCYYKLKDIGKPKEILEEGTPIEMTVRFNDGTLSKVSARIPINKPLPKIGEMIEVNGEPENAIIDIKILDGDHYKYSRQ